MEEGIVLDYLIRDTFNNLFKLKNNLDLMSRIKDSISGIENLDFNRNINNVLQLNINNWQAFYMDSQDNQNKIAKLYDNINKILELSDLQKCEIEIQNTVLEINNIIKEILEKAIMIILTFWEVMLIK